MVLLSEFDASPPITIGKPGRAAQGSHFIPTQVSRGWKLAMEVSRVAAH